ncbi:Fc receptor-like protein 5 [Sparus aurata]|uniref:Fc receptor-like protein 5 n=1 Tax=Sparus aurata TaxID=8175 RepID=UPI0011C190C6|nr:Fc receptor-like protein 5 [Sparus aurata]
MEIALLCLMLCFPVEATLRVFPDRSQFFRYENITLTCTAPDNSGSWKVKRNTSTETSAVCKFGWGIPGESSCIIESAYPSDTGVYWCESKQRGSSNTVSFTVTDDILILESPILPVMEGDMVALSCLYKEEDQVEITTNFSAVFYKDDVFIGTEPAGKMILRDVSKSHEGSYKCGHSRHGKSLQSLLTVKVHQPENNSTATPPLMSKPKLLCTILLFILYTGILTLAIYTYRKWAQVRAEANRGSFSSSGAGMKDDLY